MPVHSPDARTLRSRFLTVTVFNLSSTGTSTTQSNSNSSPVQRPPCGTSGTQDSCYCRDQPIRHRKGLWNDERYTTSTTDST